MAISKDKEFSKAHNENVEQLAWHPTEPFILASISKDGSLKIWDTKKKETIHHEKTKLELFVMSWSPDGQTIAIGKE